MRIKKIIIVLILIISLGIIGYSFHKTYVDFKEIRKKQILLEKRKDAWIAFKGALEDEIIGFKGRIGILIKDLDMEWEFSLNKDKLFPSASIVKIPIMAACFYAIAQRKIGLDTRLVLKAEHKVLGSGVLKNEPAGTEFTIDRLIELMISESDNTATNMLIELLGFDYLNGSFKNLGLKDTNISRRMMDFKSRRKGIENYTTPQDLAFLLHEIYNNRLINKDVSFKCLELLKKQKIRDRIPKRLPIGILIAHKTGLEKGTCHDVGIVFTESGDFLICVLTRHKYKNARFAKGLISRIALLTYNYYRNF